MCEWLGIELGPERGPVPAIWIPNHNKMELDSRAAYAKELFGRVEARLQFHAFLGQCMLQQAQSKGGYVEHVDYFNQWDLYWNAQAHPAREFQAARRSEFPPFELTMFRWCRLYFPSWIGHSWPSGIPSEGKRVQVDLHSMD